MPRIKLPATTVLFKSVHGTSGAVHIRVPKAATAGMPNTHSPITCVTGSKRCATIVTAMATNPIAAWLIRKHNIPSNTTTAVRLPWGITPSSTPSAIAPASCLGACREAMIRLSVR